MSVWKNLQQAQERLSHNDIVAIPTETVYGLAGSVRSEGALRKIFKTKDRPFFDPLIVHIGRERQLDEIAVSVSNLERALIKEYWPGPLTLILPKRAEISDLITAGLASVGVRMPRHPVARRLLRSLDFPLAAPSANRFGRTSPTKSQHVREEFPGTDLFILEGGDAEVGIESTVIQLLESAAEVRVQIYRPGMITAAQIKKTLEGVTSKNVSLENASSPSAPGQTDTHYQPSIPLVLISKNLSPESIAEIESHLKVPQHSRYSELVLNPDPRIAARELYGRMRELSATSIGWMYVRRDASKTSDEWQGIWNRLERAASIK